MTDCTYVKLLARKASPECLQAFDDSRAAEDEIKKRFPRMRDDVADLLASCRFYAFVKDKAKPSQPAFPGLRAALPVIVKLAESGGDPNHPKREESRVAAERLFQLILNSELAQREAAGQL